MVYNDLERNRYSLVAAISRMRADVAEFAGIWRDVLTSRRPTSITILQ